MKMKTIQELVEKETGLKLNEKSRGRDYVYARAIYFKLCTERTNKNLTEIGDSVGKHHTSVLHALNNVWPVVMAYDDDFAMTYNSIAEDESILPCEERYERLRKRYLQLLTKDKKFSLLKNDIQYIKNYRDKEESE